MNPKVNYGMWMIMICQHRSMNCVKKKKVQKIKKYVVYTTLAPLNMWMPY